MLNLYLTRCAFSICELKMLARPMQVVTKSNLIRLVRLFRFVLNRLQSFSWPKVEEMFAAGGFAVAAVTLAR